MNWKAFQKNIGKAVRIRPMAIRAEGEKESLDDEWMVTACRESPRVIELENLRTQHHVSLGPDNVVEFRTPNFLFLKCQIHINDNRRGPGVRVEPLPDPRAR